MSFIVYNTLTRSKEPFVPIHPGEVRLYACGPTVYSFAHVGNMRTNVFVDVLRRVLEYNRFVVRAIMNITDVGHLTGDGDEGEDKMLGAMRREGKTAYEIAEFYTQAFLEDLKRLNVKSADVYPRATQHLPEQIALVKKLEENGLTYRTSDGLYFDTAKLPSYGRLSGQKAEEKMAGARVDMGEKKHPTDFALWKFSYLHGRSFDLTQDDASKQRQMEWDSPWGKGFPGWHAECSAMSKKYLEVPFDIHAGAIDLIPVHHENEIAQTMGADGVPEANVWMHGAFLTVDGQKMAKSLGNVYRIQDLIERGYDPLAYRYFLLQGHYRTTVNFTFEALDAAAKALEHLRGFVASAGEPAAEGCAEDEQRFLAAINDDLNLPQALAVAWGMVGDEKKSKGARVASLMKFDDVFGLRLEEARQRGPERIPEEILDWARQREQLRLKKAFQEADVLRARIEAAGFLVEDTPSGPRVQKMDRQSPCEKERVVLE
ncbi:MAG TPA: cysteine--tRNA ligase [Patescibacteria group bacterium]|nr:cysteine--tRNA ligase [Patescibacteria group bacterium]